MHQGLVLQTEIGVTSPILAAMGDIANYHATHTAFAEYRARCDPNTSPASTMA